LWALCLSHNTLTTSTLLPNGSLVEGQFVTLENVTINTTALARSRADDSKQSSGLKLSLQSRLDLSALLQSVLTLGCDGLADLLVLDGLALLTRSLSANGGAVVGLVPGTERCSVDLDDGRAGEGVGADEFVVGGVESDDNHTDLAGDALRSPREVAAFDSQGSVLGVSATGAYEMDSLVADTGVGWLTALLESSV